MLVTQRPIGVSRNALRLPRRVETHLVDGYDWERWRFSFTPNLGQQLRSVCLETGACVLHDHGLWLHMNHVAAAVARRLGIKRVVSPRGALESWSLQYRSWKKKLAWYAYQLGDLNSVSAFSATSIGEADAIRALGFVQPIAIIPNGIALPVLPDTPRRPSEPRSVLFMSRIHPKKGLLDLIGAWSQAVKSGWELVIAGPDEGGYRRIVEEAARQGGQQSSIRFIDPVQGLAKRELLMSADVFVLPSYSENFGIVIGEALAHGIPAIATKVTPWKSLQTDGCGWWIETGALPLAAALLDAMSISDEKRAEMGRRGRALVKRDYSWHSVAKQHIDMYRSLLTGAS